MIVSLLYPLVISCEDIDITQIKSPLLRIELGPTKIVKSKDTFLSCLELNPPVNQLSNANNLYKFRLKEYHRNERKNK